MQNPILERRAERVKLELFSIAKQEIEFLSRVAFVMHGQDAAIAIREHMIESVNIFFNRHAGRIEKLTESFDTPAIVEFAADTVDAVQRAFSELT